MSQPLSQGPENDSSPATRKAGGGPRGPFETRLSAARDAAARRYGKKTSGGALSRATSSGLGLAVRVGTELVAAIAVGVGIGVALDRWLESGPWFLILFFFLGSGAAFLNVYRLVGGWDGEGLAPAESKKTTSKTTNKTGAGKAGENEG